MKTCRPFLLAICLLFNASMGIAQFTPGFTCGFDDLRTPAQEKAMQMFEEQLRHHISHKNGQPQLKNSASGVPFVVPVVVHIIHDGGSENIDDALVMAAIQHLNEGFAAEGHFADLGATVNTQIQFCLAKRDPDGQATTGITRTQSPLTNMTKETDDLATKNLSRWNPKEYVNVWVVKEITSISSGPGVAGYAYFPSSHGQPEDGMLCEARFFGKSAADDAVLIHEMGHYFGLYHTFEGGCKNDDCTADGDKVCDTPPDQVQHSVCTFNSCSTDVAPGSPFSTDVNDFTGDFLDYSPLSCYALFTDGQASRMQAAVETTRKSLLDSKGCGDPCLQPVTAQFLIPGGPIATGQAVNFTNQCTGATGFEWRVNGVIFSTLANPSYTFTGAGGFEITLIATNSDPNCSDQTTQYVTVTCPVAADFSASATAVDIGGTIFFTNTSTGATDYQWFINGVLLGSGVNFNYTFSTPGDYTIILEAGNGFCQRQQSMFVKVNSPCSGADDGAVFLYNIGNKDFYPYCITSTPDKGLLTYGQHSDNSGHTALLQKTAENGNVLWANRLENAAEIFKTIVSPNDNTYVLLGQNKTVNTVFLMKTDAATGALVWKKDFTNLPAGSLTYELLCLPNNDLLVLMAGSNLARFSPSGNLIWSKELDPGVVGFFSGLARRPDGVILITGFDPSQGFDKTSVVFLDENGVVLDTKYYGIPGHQSVIFNSVVANADNSYTVAGSSRVFGSSYTEQRGIVFKCDPSGNIIWSKKLEFQAANGHSAVKNYIVKTSDGGYILYGAPTITFENRLFMKIDSVGNMLWGREFQVPNTSMIIANIAGNGTPGCWVAQHGSNRLLIAKVNGDGTAGGCGEINHDILATDFPLTTTTILAPIAPFTLNVSAGTVNLTPTIFQKQTLCTHPAPCPEICGNGFDDDNDNFVDCFDSDCPCFDPDTACTVVPPNKPLAAKIKWESAADLVQETTSAVVGNLNPQTDSIPEIVVLSGDADELIIFRGDGSNKDNPVRFKPLNANILDYTPPLLVDVNADGIPELLYAGWDGIIQVYTNYQENQNPPFTLMCASTPPSTGWISRLNAADFDQDGVPEIYVGRQIYTFDFSNPAAPTLTRKLIGTGHSGGMPGAGSGLWDVPQAADLLSRSDCNGDPDCDGLELAAGANIYSIDLDPTDGDGLQIKIQRNLNLMAPGAVYSDGFTQIADMNLDGTPDIVVNGVKNLFTTPQKGFYVWDKNGLISFFPGFVSDNFQAWGKLTIANVFDDRTQGFAQDFPEIIRKMGDTLRVAAYNLQAQALHSAKPFWWEAPSDDRSTDCFITAFDFNRDGFDELVAKGDSFLRVYYGGAAPFPLGVNPSTRIWCQVPHLAGTIYDGPIVADANGDHEAEILYTYRTNSTSGRLRVLETANYPWPGARPIWNHYSYFHASINDDLTVPKTQQKHWLEMGGIGSGKRPFNTHLAQLSSLNPLNDNRIKVPDARITLDSIRCQTDSFEVFLNFCNAGSTVLPTGTPLAFYIGDPTSTPAPLLFPPVSIPEKLDAGACKSIKLTIPAAYNTSIFGVINDDATLPPPFNLSANFPPTAQLECHYDNNMVSFSMQHQTPPLDLGPDLSLCSNSVVTLSASPGFQRYRWQDGSTDASFTAFLPGKYWVDAFDACGYRQTDTLNITLNVLKTLNLPDALTVCAGETVNLDATGFTKYTWAPADSVSCADCTTVDVLANNSITILLTAADGDCFVSDSVRINISPNPVVQLSTQNGNCDVPAYITPIVSGEAPFVFQWSNTSLDSILTTTKSGTYTVEITDKNGCQAADSATVSIDNSLAVSFLSTAPACALAATGSIDVTVGAGQPPFQFLWSNSATSEDLTGVPAGSYSVVATDANGCTAVIFTTLTEPPALSLNLQKTDPVCAGGASGSIDLTAAGGSGNLAFSWSNSAATEDLSGLAAGSYSVVVTDVNGCSGMISTLLTDPPAVVLGLQKADPSCAGEATGAIDLTASGGTGSLAYLWSNSAGTEDITALPAASYSVVVTDANGCTDTISAILTDPPAIALTLLISNPKCAGEASGMLDLSASGGTGNLAFLWSDSSVQEDITALAAGSYTVVVTDANGCTDTASGSLTDPPALVAGVQITDPLCAGEASGAIDLSASGGTGTLLFFWTGNTCTEDLNLIQAGSYTVTITDANGCTATVSATLTDPPALALSLQKTNMNCPGDAGFIDLTVDGGIQPHTYLWSSGETTEDISVSQPGAYTAIVRDAHGCTASETVLVSTLGAPPTLQLATDTLTCLHPAGVIAVISDLPNTAFLWQGANGFSSTLPAPAVSANGVYSVTATEPSGGCTTIGSVTVAIDTVAPTLHLVANYVELPCGLDSISLSAAGSSSGPDFSIHWTVTAGGTILSGANSLSPGIGSSGVYRMAITDLANGCSATGAVEVVQTGQFTGAMHADPVRCFGETNGAIQIISTSGGVPPFTYSIDNQNFITDPVFENLAAGMYQIAIRDVNGCEAVTEIEVTQPAPVSVELTGDSLVVQGNFANLHAIVSPPGFVPAQMVWTAAGVDLAQNQFEQSVQLFQPTQFQISISDDKGCAASDTFLVRVEEAHKVYVPNIMYPESANSDNRTFVIFSGPDVMEVAYLKIFDRWGDQVFQNLHFQPNDASQGWDGTFRGNPVNPGVYVWVTKLLFKDGSTQVLQGDLTVLR